MVEFSAVVDCIELYETFIGVIINALMVIGTFLAVIVAFIAIRKGDSREEKRFKQGKIESLLSLLVDIWCSLDNIKNVHQKDFEIMPSYDTNPVLSLDTDIRNVQRKVIDIAVLLNAYIGVIAPFKTANSLLNGSDGYFASRHNFIDPMMGDIKKGIKRHYTEQEAQEKKKLDEKSVEILKEAIKFLQDAHYELVEKLKEISK